MRKPKQSHLAALTPRHWQRTNRTYWFLKCHGDERHHVSSLSCLLSWQTYKVLTSIISCFISAGDCAVLKFTGSSRGHGFFFFFPTSKPQLCSVVFVSFARYLFWGISVRYLNTAISLFKQGFQNKHLFFLSWNCFSSCSELTGALWTLSSQHTHAHMHMHAGDALPLLCPGAGLLRVVG